MMFCELYKIYVSITQTIWCCNSYQAENEFKRVLFVVFKNVVFLFDY